MTARERAQKAFKQQGEANGLWTGHSLVAVEIGIIEQAITAAVEEKDARIKFLEEENLKLQAEVWNRRRAVEAEREACADRIKRYREEEIYDVDDPNGYRLAEKLEELIRARSEAK